MLNFGGDQVSESDCRRTSEVETPKFVSKTFTNHLRFDFNEADLQSDGLVQFLDSICIIISNREQQQEQQKQQQQQQQWRTLKNHAIFGVGSQNH